MAQDDPRRLQYGPHTCKEKAETKKYEGAGLPYYLWTILEHPGTILEYILEPFWSILDHLGTIWHFLVTILGPSWNHFGLSWDHFGESWTLLDHIGMILGPSLGNLGTILDHLGSFLGGS